jgi:hypothetical protein
MSIPIPACRICGGRELLPVLSLGLMPPVNSFLKGEAEIAAEKKHPLAIAQCPACTHVQLTHMLDPKDVFEHYLYFSSMSETVVKWGQQLAARYAAELSLKNDELVAELASNDGCILKPFKAHCRIHGVEPARNIAEVANKEGVPTTAEFFDSRLAKKVRAEVGRARLILARNVVAHVPEVVDFVAGAAHWLTDDGIFHVEVPYLKPMVDGLEFDTIYHEHLSYFSVTSLDALFKKAGLVLWDVEEIPLHGGSLIARGKKGAAAKPSVAKWLAAEKESGLNTMPRLQRFAEGTERLKEELPKFLLGLKQQGKSLAAYGAAAKGVVLTNYCGLGKETFEFVADRSPYKQGRLMPGTHVPVVAPQVLIDRRPDYAVVLAWNFFDEIARQLAPYTSKGGKLITPVPAPKIHQGA